MDKDLKELLDVFGAEFSQEDIASAYRQSSNDKCLAAEMLCTTHENAENTAALEVFSEFESKTSISSEISASNVIGEAFGGQKETEELLSKRGSASMGAVSSIIGKEYANPRLLRNEYVEAKKPLKLQGEPFPVSESLDEKSPSSMEIGTNYAQADVEEFLFKMLGEGFQLDRHRIQEVLGLCGYDIQTSVDKLLDLSAATMERTGDTGMAAKNSTGTYSLRKSVSLKEPAQQLDSYLSDGAGMVSRNSLPKAKSKKDKKVLEKELLLSLFDLPNISEEGPTRTVSKRLVKKSNRFGKVVVEPFNDDPRKDKPSMEEAIVVSKEEDADDSYDVLRKAVKEYWNTTKEYYKAAIDAFTKGDHARANTLLEQGQFFNKRARETDNESHVKLLETRVEEEMVMPIKLQELEPKEAVQLLRVHLTSLSGIPSVKYLRLFVNNSDAVSRNKARKKLIVKQLEKESIKWKEEEKGETILIKVDGVDPKRLSFAKKESLGA